MALLAEDAGGLGTAVGRQLLRTRRPMTATVLSADGEVQHRMTQLTCSPSHGSVQAMRGK